MSKIILALTILFKIVLAIAIGLYYWNTNDFEAIKRLPIFLLLLCVLYILLQMLTRRLTKVNNWWDWVYYVGLVSIMLPVLFAKANNQHIFHLITDFGTLALLIPALVDGYLYTRPQTKSSN